MADLLMIPSPFEIRDELHQLVLNDLLGPAGGPNEEVDEQAVRERYLVGMLAPRRISTEPNQQDELAVAGTGMDEDGNSDSGAMQSNSLIPSSFGLTFSVDGTATAIRVTARWGHYQREESPTLTNEEGNPKRIWRRYPIESSSPEIPLKEGKIASWVVDENYPEVVVRGLTRKRQNDWIVTLFLVNGQNETKTLKDEKWLFQPELIVEAPEKSPVFVRRCLKHDRSRMDVLAWFEEQTMAMLYRHKKEFAVGHGVAVHAEPDLTDKNRAIKITTVSVPVCEIPMQTPPTKEEIPGLADLMLDMKAIAGLSIDRITQHIEALPKAYSEWIKKEHDKITADPTLFEYKEQANEAVDNCTKACARIEEGIALLKADPKAAEAFLFSNRAMWLQRIHTIYAEQVRRGLKPKLEDIDIETNRSWYPFQLAFILLNLPGITILDHKDRIEKQNATADLLWFPTGGGKTEAYLGLTAYTLAIRRLQGTIGGYEGEHGVAVLMRYTLRVLTLQQFQRAATLICACESIRFEGIKAGDQTLGAEPFRVGIWVGQRTTPNTTEQSEEAIRLDHGHFRRASLAAGSGSPAQLKNCPWCGMEIKPGRDIQVETFTNGRCRTFMYCGDPLGQCPFSRRQSPDEGIPVMLVDEEIYRRLPSLLIATVDKFAQMPWKGAVQMLFGRVSSYCPRHGFRSPDIEDSESHPKKGSFPAVKSIPHGRLRPPDLIIQDELHLISGPLGTLVGLYETAVDKLASWEVNGKTVRPKVIASTATIRRAENQIHQLFLRRADIFPTHGTDVRDNFFSIQREPCEQLPGRRYLGICAVGKRIKTATIRVDLVYLAAAQKLYEKYGKAADPWMTLVGYFNSMRELGGARRLVDDSVRSMLRETIRRGLANRKRPFVKELTSRITATDIPEILDQLEVIFDPEDDKRRQEAHKAGRMGDIQYPIDVLLATNMVSVGVDVKRLGLMVVNGQPKTTAEYIQATSRIGRNKPGIVCIVFNWARPRDLSHYERFEHYHATFYQHVEALSLTPFAARAIDRGLAALLVSLIRLDSDIFNANKSAAGVNSTHEQVVRAIETIVERSKLVESPAVAELIQTSLKARLDRWRADAKRPTGGNLLGYRTEKDGITVGLLQPAGLGPWDDFTCLTSLREVEPNVSLILDNRDTNTLPGSPDSEVEGDGDNG